ncbi:MAG: hypothetical protein DHS20C15_14560 [Planctomycetota bacterium]|nr:MAG: hypothetical protein DHS20C15_14560 [Planctomycetota bacterium]
MPTPDDAPIDDGSADNDAPSSPWGASPRGREGAGPGGREGPSPGGREGASPDGPEGKRDRAPVAPDPAFAAEVERLIAPHLSALPGLEAAPDDLATQLGGFCAGLLAANATINLTGLKSAEDMAFGHVLDSLIALPLIGDRGTLLDLGSGCGVPGVPFALAQPARKVLLCESRARKSEALAGLVSGLELGPRVSVLHDRAETWLVEQKVDTVVARAVGRVGKLLEFLSPVRHGFKRLVLLKGPSVDAELDEVAEQLPTLGFELEQRVDAQLPEERGARVLLVFKPLKRDRDSRRRKYGKRR